MTLCATDQFNIAHRVHSGTYICCIVQKAIIPTGWSVTHDLNLRHSAADLKLDVTMSDTYR